MNADQDPYDESQDGGEQPVAPRFSICIPTYNRATLLRPTIESALRELSRHDGEIVVIDNASNDDTESVVADIGDRRIRYRRYSNTVSMFANHNRSIAAARGQWVVFLHSDDEFPDRYLDTTDRWIRDCPAADLFCSFSHHEADIDAPSPFISDPNVVGPMRALAVAAGVLMNGGGAPSGAVYRRSAFDVSGGFDDRWLCADAMLVIRWALDGRGICNFPHDPPVWSEKACSTSSQLEYQRDQWRMNAPLFNTALTHDRGPELRAWLCDLGRRLPPRRKLRLIGECLKAGRRDLVWEMVAGDRAAWRCMLDRRLYTHIAPIGLAPSLFASLRYRLRRTRKLVS